ncbi:MAG: hypothetical protein IKD47_02530 [Clostridia bacterium]|nr:hypothetical protein [Clostridia bacterium]
MKNFQAKKTVFSRLTKLVGQILATLFVLFFSFSCVSCKKTVEYFDYVSELRSNIFICETETLSLRVYAVRKESPYATDGIPKESVPRAEVRLVAPSFDKTCQLSFSIHGKTYGGEMSFDNVKTEYYYACTLDISALREIVCKIEYGDTAVEMTAKSVLTERTIPAKTALKNIYHEEKALFDSLTDRYGFAGEIHIRLLYEDAPYYYVGVIDRSGNINAFLVNAETGKILAKRQSQTNI